MTEVQYPDDGKMMENVLQVKMFGGFSVMYNGISLLGGKKSNETQFAYLLQILLHYRQNGVSREQLEQIMFEDRDIENVHHAMQSVIYNAKKKLEKTGLPKMNYIQFSKGIFCWNNEIPVIEDSTQFEQLVRRAAEETDRNSKLELYMQAVYLYSGEFLSAYAGVMWAAQEARKYRAMFCDCVEQAAELLRRQGDFLQMERLGKYAASIMPLSDWETITMEALVELGRHEDALQLYADTVDLYFREQGLRPSKKLMESLNELGAIVEHPYEVLDTIQQDLGAINGDNGGYICSYPVFCGIYHMVERMMERGGQTVCLMLCTLVDSKGNVMRKGPLLEEISERLGESICCAVRRGDAVNKYSKGQYLVLLINTTVESCSVVQRRIDKYFKTGRQRISVRYYVNAVEAKQV